MDLGLRRREALLALPGVDGALGLLEGLRQRPRLLQGAAEIGVAEIGPFPLVGTAEGAAVGARGRHDERVVVLQRRDEAAGEAGRDDDDLVLDLGQLQQGGQLAGLDIAQSEARERDIEDAGIAVRGQEQDQHVLLAVHDLGHAAQRLVEVGDAEERRLLDRARVIDEQDRAALECRGAGREFLGGPRSPP